MSATAEGREFENTFENWDPNPNSKLHSRLGMLHYDGEGEEWKVNKVGIL